MERSEPFISESESSCLNESLFIGNGELKNQQVEEGNGKKQEIVIKTELLEKYPHLFDSTIKIFQERSSNEELRKKASEYQEIKHRFQEERKLSSGNLHQSSEIRENEEEINVFEEYRKLQIKIKEIQEEREEQMMKIEEKDVEKLGNRLKIKLLVKIIKDAKENYESNPYVNIDEEYKQELDRILAEYNELERSQFGVESEEPGPEQEHIKRHEEARREKIKQEITKLEALEEAFHKMTEKEKEITENLKKEIKRFQAEQSTIYGQINHSEDINLKREILCELVEKFINEKMKDEGLDHGLDKPIDQYIKEIESLENETATLKEELQSLSIVNTEKQNACILLEKRLTELQKQNKLSVESLGKQNEINSSPQAKLLNNEDKILKAYMFEGNKMQSEISQMEHKHQTKEVDMFLEEQNKACLECNQKVIVKKYSLGFIQNILPIKNSKQLLTFALIIWFLVLFFLFSWKFLIHYDYLPKPEPMKPARTIVHRYQGKTRIVDGEIVNISHFDENIVDREHEPLKMEESEIEPSERETIVVETLSEQPQKTWKELLMMEYK